MNSITNISSYSIEGKKLPKDVENKIIVCHIEPLGLVEKLLQADGYNISLSVSSKSGYRSVSWEKLKGRSGFSQHTFKGLGAVDLTFNNFQDNKDSVINALIEYTNYTRIAVYNSFIHIDYKNAQNDRFLYKVVNGVWKRDCKV